MLSKEKTEEIRQKRLGEENTNTRGSKMTIIEYHNSSDITVRFETGYIVQHTTYYCFKNGEITDLLWRSFLGHGYIGIGPYKVRKTKEYAVWSDMLRRCYSEKSLEKYPSYIGCEVAEEWLNYQTFADWYFKHYYNVNNEKMCLDKDILKKHNKKYCPEYCCIVPAVINNLLVKSDHSRGKWPIGVSYHKETGKFVAQLERRRTKGGKALKKADFETPEEAFNFYKINKELYIKEMADKYKKYLPQNVYDALYSYEVEISD